MALASSPSSPLSDARQRAPSACPDCHRPAVERVGGSLSFGHYAGGALHWQRGGESAIYRCTSCQLVFKHPRLGDDESTALYNQVDGQVWTSNMPRPEFDAARRTVSDCRDATPAVLDVGCNRGEFLASLPQQVRKHGIEVNQAAAAQARREGALVWNNLADVRADIRADKQAAFDVVTCFDVIEHVAEPASFLRTLLALLKPGGRLVVSSGDAAVFLRQPRPALNWYFSNPEHISFISAPWLSGLLKDAREHELEAEIGFLHGRAHQGFVPWLKIAAFKAWPWAYLSAYSGLKARLSPATGLFVPGNGFEKDHRCFIVRRRP